MVKRAAETAAGSSIGEFKTLIDSVLTLQMPLYYERTFLASNATAKQFSFGQYFAIERRPSNDIRGPLGNGGLTRNRALIPPNEAVPNKGFSFAHRQDQIRMLHTGTTG